MDVNPMIKGIQAATGSAPAEKRPSETPKAMAEAKPTDVQKEHTDATAAKLSDELTQLSTDNLVNSIQAQPDIDQEKITVIKDAIAKGEYPLDTTKIAQAFLTLESILN